MSGDHDSRSATGPLLASALTRRSALTLLAGASVTLAGCGSSMDYARQSPPPVSTLPVPAGDVLGTGSVRVALLLPRTAQGNAGALAASMRNAAEMALNDFRGNDLTVLVKDTAGTPEGAAAAANGALAERVELIIGPVFAAEVRAAGPIARNAGIPMLSFSSDPTVATTGVYVMGFLVGDQVRQVVAQAAAAGKRSMAALIPESAYGNLAEAALREAAARSGVRLVQVERYTGRDVAEKARVVAGAAGQIDSVFVPEGPGVAPQVAAVFGSSGVDPSRVRLLGSGQWNDASVYGNAALAGGWFPAPDLAAFQQFAGRYRAAYGSEPQLTATLAYDAVVLAAGLVRAAGARRFDASVIANPEGFLSSVNGLFRFNPNGTNDRGYSIYEVTGSTPRLIAAGPRSFAGF